MSRRVLPAWLLQQPLSAPNAASLTPVGPTMHVQHSASPSLTTHMTLARVRDLSSNALDQFHYLGVQHKAYTHTAFPRRDAKLTGFGFPLHLTHPPRPVLEHKPSIACSRRQVWKSLHHDGWCIGHDKQEADCIRVSWFRVASPHLSQRALSRRAWLSSKDSAVSAVSAREKRRA